MPLPTAAELTDPSATNIQMKQMLGQLADGAASKEELNEQVGEAKDQTEQAIDKIEKLGVVHNSNDDLIFAILDELGRRTWLGVGKDGKPDPYSLQCIKDAISSFVNQVAELMSKDAISDVGITSTEGQKILFAVTDKDGRKTAFELGMDGKLTEYAANSIADSVGIKQAGSNSSLLWALTDADGRRTWLGVGKDGKPDLYTVQCMREALNVEEKANVLKFLFSGDSMTYGAGSGGFPVTKWFNDLLVEDGITNAQITNFGVGGETSVTICARQGGNPFVVTVDDGFIPATTEAVRVTLQPINGQPVQPLLQSSSWVGELNGLKGHCV